MLKHLQIYRVKTVSISVNYSANLRRRGSRATRTVIRRFAQASAILQTLLSWMLLILATSLIGFPGLSAYTRHCIWSYWTSLPKAWRHFLFRLNYLVSRACSAPVVREGKGHWRIFSWRWDPLFLDFVDRDPLKNCSVNCVWHCFP